MDGPALELICPRCGAEFGRGPREIANAREAWQRFVHHAQRDHDLDELEAYALLFKGPRRESVSR